MQSETVQLNTPLNQAGAADALALLRQAPGVKAAKLVSAGDAIEVEFERGKTSAPQLRSILESSGLAAAKFATARDGTCCGGCCEN